MAPLIENNNTQKITQLLGGMADALVLGTSIRKVVQVRVL